MNETTDIAAAIPVGNGQAFEPTGGERGYAFGRFMLFPIRQVLFDGDTELRLGGRAAAILTLLVERAGHVVTKDEILDTVWPSTTVDEGNLRVQVAALRKALRDTTDRPDFIASVVGRGYRFVGLVERVDDSRIATHRNAAPNQSYSRLPTPLAKLIGRRATIDDIVRLVGEQRLVTIVGPGGIGKTTIALAAARRLPEVFVDGMVFVDLAAVADESLVPFAVAAAFNISAETDDPVASLIGFLKDRRAFVLLDNCEHVIDAAARLAETLLKGVPNLRMLATSHEPLRAEGEWLFRLAPLDLPSHGRMGLQEAMLYPAIELFVDRATSDDQSLMLTEHDVPFIVDICRRLDGIPLAIEIAAARVEVFGIGELADRLDERLDVPNAGRRTAVERHHTMRKMLDWSHENLGAAERMLLRRIAVFAGAFSLEAAKMVAGDEQLGDFAITEAIASLVRKSLLHPNSASRLVTYRLLESTRIYAAEKQIEAGEFGRLRYLHLQFAIDMLQRAEADWTTTRRAVWIERYAPLLDDVRQALSWAFSATGDAAAGVRLTALAMPLGMQIGLVDEFRERNDIAMARARALPVPELVAEMRLNIFTAFLNTNQSQPLDETMNGVARAVHLAERTGEDRYRLQPLFQLAGFKMGMGDYRAALAFAEELGALGQAVGDGMAILGSQRMLAQTSHFNGQHGRSSALARAVLASPVVNIPIAFGSIQVDRRVSMRIVLSRSLWLQGKAEQALAVMREAVDIAPEDGPHALCHALSQAACPISLWRGDHDAIDGYVERLLDESSRFTLNHWNSWGQMYARWLAQGRRQPSGAAATPIATEGDLQVHTLATLSGQMAGIDVADTELVGRTGWAAPEILRRRGLALVDKDARQAEAVFERSLEVAGQQGALAWELRTMTSLAALLARQNQGRLAAQRLGDVYDRFTEGFDTVDLVAAARLMATMSSL